jgi:endonuclease-3 related protein
MFGSDRMKTLLMDIYDRMYQAYGPQHWWPGETAFEMMVGAILTQNTSWMNVEKAIDVLKRKGVLTPEGLRQLKKPALASMIRPSGYYRIKADRLRAFIDFLWEDYGGNIRRMGMKPLNELRQQLLQVKGVGPETADSILLYGLKKPVFVIDAYTKRILSRHGIISEKASYDETQKLFMDHLPQDERLFNEYHALIVRVGKTLCKKTPKCGICPLNRIAHGVKRKAHRAKSIEQRA